MTRRGPFAACSRPACVAAALLLCLAATGIADTTTSRPYQGVTLVERVEDDPRPMRMRIAQVDLDAPGVRVTVSPPAGAREAVRETTLGFLERIGAQLAVNAHFFLPFPSTDQQSWVIGLAASEGRIFSAFEHPEQGYAITSGAPALNVDRRNRARIVHRDPKRGDRQVRGRVTLWNAVSGSAQIVTDGRVTIPVYRDRAHPRGTLTPGSSAGYSNDKSWYDVVTARTVAGLSRNNRVLTLFTVDARGRSAGMRVAEIAALLVRDYGVWNAINLDGGGSTSMAWRNPETGEAELLNTSSDSPGGRAVASSLAVFARTR